MSFLKVKKLLLLLVGVCLVFSSQNLWADEWDQIENEFTIKFQNQLEPFFPQQNTHALSIDEFSLMTGVFTEYSIFLLNIRIQPYVKFRFSKQKD